MTLSFTRTSLQECLKLDWLDVGDESGSEFMCGVLSWPMVWQCIQKVASSYFLHQLWRHYVALNMRNYTVTANYKHPNHSIKLTFAVVAWINKYIYIERQTSKNSFAKYAKCRWKQANQSTVVCLGGHLPMCVETRPMKELGSVVPGIFTVLSQISLFMYGVDHTFWYNSHSHIHHSHFLGDSNMWHLITIMNDYPLVN